MVVLNLRGADLCALDLLASLQFGARQLIRLRTAELGAVPRATNLVLGVVERVDGHFYRAFLRVFRGEREAFLCRQLLSQVLLDGDVFGTRSFILDFKRDGRADVLAASDTGRRLLRVQQVSGVDDDAVVGLAGLQLSCERAFARNTGAAVSV